MKKIVAVVQVQNEADIIESLCRYYCGFCDGILVTDNMSSDNTPNILKSLVEEGLPVIVTNHRGLKLYYNYVGQYHKAIEWFNADVLLPIDADEFLVDVNGGNPRPILESLDEKTEYHIQCRNYTCPRELKGNTLFYPSNIDKYSVFSYNKTVISRFLIKERNAYPIEGNHSFLYNEDPPDIIDIKKLCYNHYPIRNVYQFMLKIILGRVIHLALPRHDGSIHYMDGWHWKAFYEEIKKHGTISQEMLERYSAYTETSLPKDDNYKLIEGPFDTSFCNDKLTLRYTNYNIAQERFLQMLTTQLEKNLLNVMSRRHVDERIEAGEQLSIANTTIYNLNNYIKQLEDIHNTFLWKVLKKLRNIFKSLKYNRRR